MLKASLNKCRVNEETVEVNKFGAVGVPQDSPVFFRNAGTVVVLEYNRPF
jgi:hypothetical protein